MTASEFAQCIAFLSATVGREMAKPQAEAWFQILGDLEPIELQRGIVHALREQPVAGFPPVGTILKHARPVVSVDAETRAVAAWEGVLDAIRRIGGYATVQFDDAAVTASVRALGGWVRLTEQPTEELLRFVRPQFLQTYKALSQTGVRAEAAEPLIGLLDAENLRKGVPPEAPTVVALRLPGPKTRVLAGLVHRQESAQPAEQRGLSVFQSVAERLAAQ